jgi:murein DD-endopeptidase MepM/ murein hydrolase activator NlpD
MKIKSIESDFASLTDKIAAQKKVITESMGPIKNKLAYLKAKPSIMPVTASITASFGYRKNPFTSRGSEFHKGTDFAASYGKTVAATGDGIVMFAGWNAGYGKMVIISHGYGITTLYAHNSKLLVKQGDKVKKGQAISKVGNTGRSTGTHLHYEVKLNGKNVNPTKYFN